MDNQQTLDLPIKFLRPLVTQYNQIADSANWNRFTSIPSEGLDPESLSTGQKEAVAFCTFIEDHTPRYIEDYRKRFPISAEVGIDRSLSNRELFHFLVRWGVEEDRHAQALAVYQVRSGIVRDQEALEEELIRENIKEFQLGFSEPVQVFTYTFLQEKATQIYYQCLSKAVKEPVLKGLLLNLAKDESRHFSFFTGVLDAFVSCYGKRVLPLIQEVAGNYRMPLFSTLPDYARRAVRMGREAPGYSRKMPLQILASHLESLSVQMPELAKDLKKTAREILRENNLEVLSHPSPMLHHASMNGAHP
ncbi:MAG: acyl-ACP desaturase [Leptospirales bacterium]